MRKKKPQGTPKTTSGRVLSNPVSPHLSFAAALRGQGSHQQNHDAPDNTCNPGTTAPQTNVLKTGQFLQAPIVSSDSLDMIRAITVAQQIMAELKGTASEESKFVALAKTVFNLLKDNGKYSS
jgi:hypothetical protein